jgi:hypothetical protein
MNAMTADPKWLEILKASGWHTAALACASAAILFLNAKKLLPVAPESWLIQGAEVGLFVFGFLTLANVGSHLEKPLRSWFGRRRAVHKAKCRVEEYIPSMTPKEREIVGYLLANNLKTFTYTVDGGAANTLISRGIVACALLPGQSCTNYGVPFVIPEHVWDVLLKHRAEFPNTWKSGDPYPYSIDWTER